ncbi:hypothetical protein BDK51DRAFT_50133 [Blyttiomyces helicus]|uniref:Uncharacterized protein n=1 Tax=Blyttiomyces helicus TaxID=388810 RepID=A0A4P9WHE5_9FUNG|nr:hypothetical protein BDK51DRAFT_50133 [Blyttiomyces helicus]|eukprot:RKO89956.1 hypothetical protein BDK51DRAFT_50133 [Blyttiomyces helicus]
MVLTWPVGATNSPCSVHARRSTVNRNHGRNNHAGGREEKTSSISTKTFISDAPPRPFYKGDSAPLRSRRKVECGSYALKTACPVGGGETMDWRKFRMHPPRLEAALPNLQVIEISGRGDVSFLTASLVRIRLPLRRLVLTADHVGLLGDLPAAGSPYDALASLEDHPPLTVLMLCSIESCGHEGQVSSASISNTAALSAETLSSASPNDVSTPLLDVLFLEGYRWDRPAGEVNLSEIMFIANLIGGCPHLHHVYLNVALLREHDPYLPSLLDHQSHERSLPASLPKAEVSDFLTAVGVNLTIPATLTLGYSSPSLRLRPSGSVDRCCHLKLP